MSLGIVALAIVGAVLSLLLSELGFRGKAAFSTLIVLTLLAGVIAPLGKIFSSLSDIAREGAVSDAVSLSLRVIGLGYIFGITSDVCRTLGEPSVANTVTLVGRLQIILVSYPYFEKIIALGMELLG